MRGLDNSNVCIVACVKYTVYDMVFVSLIVSAFCRESDYAAEFDYFLRGKESLRMDIRVPPVSGLSKEQVCQHFPRVLHTVFVYDHVTESLTISFNARV